MSKMEKRYNHLKKQLPGKAINAFFKDDDKALGTALKEKAAWNKACDEKYKITPKVWAKWLNDHNTGIKRLIEEDDAVQLATFFETVCDDEHFAKDCMIFAYGEPITWLDYAMKKPPLIYIAKALNVAKIIITTNIWLLLNEKNLVRVKMKIHH